MHFFWYFFIDFGEDEQYEKRCQGRPWGIREIWRHGILLWHKFICVVSTLEIQAGNGNSAVPKMVVHANFDALSGLLRMLALK